MVFELLAGVAECSERFLDAVAITAPHHVLHRRYHLPGVAFAVLDETFPRGADRLARVRRW